MRFKKYVPALRFSLALLAAGLVAVSVAPRKGAVLHAQNGCDATTFSGVYGSNLSGSVYDNQGYVYLLASVGRFVFDGAGNITGADTTSFDGSLNRRTFTGTYTVNADCTGSVTFQFGSNGTVHGDIVAVNDAKQINFVQTDTDYIFSGTLVKQAQTAAPAK